MDSKIKILFLASKFDIGGVQKANISMINGINKDKFNVHVLYINEGVLMEDLEINKVKISKIGDIINLKSFETIKYIFKVIKYIKENKIDVVHTIDPMFYVVGATAAHFTKIKHVRTQPNFIRRHEKLNTKTLKILPFERWTDKFITYNYASAKDLELAGVSKEKIEVIYGFTTKEEYLEYKVMSDIREEFNIPRKHKIILAMHRMVPKKGYETFIEMIPFIIKDRKSVV